jgi:CRISPR-associated protein Csm3
MLDVSLFQAFFILCHSKLTLGSVKLIDTGIYKIDKKDLNSYIFNGLQDEMRWQYV